MRTLVIALGLVATVAGSVPAESRTGGRYAEASREELEAKQARMTRHLLRVQRERFEAKARGESPQKLERLTREFERTEERRRGVLRELERLGAAD